MALLRNRPLALAALAFCAVLFLSFFLNLPTLLLATAVLSVVLFPLIFCVVKRGWSARRLYLLLLCVATLLACGRGTLRALWQKEVDAYIGEVTEAELVVREVKYVSSYGSELLVRVEALDGQGGHGYAILRADTALPFYLNDRISGEFRVESLAHEGYAQGSVYSYYADEAGMLLIAEVPDDLLLLESGSSTLSARLGVFRTSLRVRICEAVPGEGGRLIAAMLLGERSGLSPEVARDFRRIGTSHLLAISGLHLAILVAILDRFLYLLRVGKRARMLTVLPLLAAYTVLVGGSFSVIRAALMLLLLYLSYLAKGDHDPLTALSCSAALILLFTPGAIFDLSFQLTVMATLGLLTFGRLQTLFLRFIPRGKGVIRVPLSLLRTTVSSLTVSFSATLAILPIVWLNFGEISLLTPLSNLILLPIVPVFLVLSILVLVLPFAPIGALAGLPANAILWIASMLSRPDAMLSLRYDFVPYILIPLFVLTAVLLLVDLKRLWPLVASPALAGAVAFAICLVFTHAAGREQLHVLYRRAGENEGLVLLQNDRAILCDSSNGSLTQLRANYHLAADAGATRIEALMLTHYHKRMITSLSAFSKEVRLKAIWAPMPISEQDGEVLAAITELVKEQGITLRLYAPNEVLEGHSGVQIRCSELLYESRSTQAAFALNVRFMNSELCYHTAAFSEFVRHAEIAHDCTPQTLLLGAHGPVPHEAVVLPESETLSTVVVGGESALAHLEMRPMLRYYFLEESLSFLLW